MKNLIIITNNMYDGNWLVDELKFHSKMNYKQILVFNTKNITLQADFDHNIKCYILAYKRLDLILKMFHSIFNVRFLNEVHTICKRKKIKRIESIYKALMHLATACVYAKQIDRVMLNNGISRGEHNVFYAYWMSVQAEVFFDLKKKYSHSSFVSRCHSIDIYEERDKTGYLEYRQQLINLLDRVYSISDNGKSYLESHYACDSKCYIARLGSHNTGMFIKKGRANIGAFKIVTCSSLLTVKRIHLVVDILSKIKDIPIVWHHYGTGPLLEELEYKAQCLPANINYEFKGYIDHKTLFNLYAEEEYDLLMNVSYIEGIPVSMMEALSIGIPLLGTNVGGVSEIIKNEQTGFLVDRDATIEDIVEMIRKIISINDTEYALLRENCVEFWGKNYNQEVNYRLFAENVFSFVDDTQTLEE